MNQLDKATFKFVLEKNYFDTVKNNDKESMQAQANLADAFDCLVAFIVNEYEETDLLRYFIKEEYSFIEAKPSLEPNSWRIGYWIQLLGFWARKLFNPQKYKLSENQDGFKLQLAIKGIKRIFKNHNNAYITVSKLDSFKDNLNTVVDVFSKTLMFRLLEINDCGVTLPQMNFL